MNDSIVDVRELHILPQPPYHIPVTSQIKIYNTSQVQPQHGILLEKAAYM